MTTGTDGTLLIRITRPEGYEDVHPELVLEDCGVKPEFLPEIAQDALSAARLEGWRMAIQAAAKACEHEVGNSAISFGVRFGAERCAAAVRALPEPEEGK